MVLVSPISKSKRRCVINVKTTKNYNMKLKKKWPTPRKDKKGFGHKY